jgi:FAD/FMN-containing dehydrogenase
MMDPLFVNALEKVCGAKSIRAAEDLAMQDYGFHAENLGATCAVRPTSTAQVSDILKLCNRFGVSVVPQGGLTGLAGGAVSNAGQVIVSSARLLGEIEIDPVNRIAHVAAGTTLEALDHEAHKHGLCAGIDIGARATATIGGMIATNAGGSEAFRNGIMRNRVLGLEAVSATGIVMSDLKRVTKANEGIDVKQLFIGSEGTLGVITRAVLRLAPAPGICCTFIASFADTITALNMFHTLNAMSFARLLRAEIMWRDYAVQTAMALGLQTVLPAPDRAVHVAFEMEPLDGSVDTFLESLAEQLDKAGCEDVIVAQNDRERNNIWKVREDSWALEKTFSNNFWYDVSLPHSMLDRYVTHTKNALGKLHPSIRTFVMGHLGDGNLHLTISGDAEIGPLHAAISDIVYNGLAQSGASFSAEHGIGIEKRPDLERFGDAGKLTLMRMIKSGLDPNGIMNPGKVIKQHP